MCYKSFLCFNGEERSDNVFPLVEVTVCYIYSLQMGQFSDPVATHPRTNEVEVPPGLDYPKVCIHNTNYYSKIYV